MIHPIFRDLQISVHILKFAVRRKTKPHRACSILDVRLQRRGSASDHIEALDVRILLPPLLDQVRHPLRGSLEIDIYDRTDIDLSFSDLLYRILAILDSLHKLRPARERIAVSILHIANDRVEISRHADLLARTEMIIDAHPLYHREIRCQRADFTYADLKAELNGAHQQLSETVTVKDQTIEQLQNTVIQLSQQTEDMNSKVEEMKKLESDLKSIAQIDMTDEDRGKTAITQHTAEDSVNHGMGGALIPAAEEEILQLGEDTKSDLTSLGSQLEQLRTSFVETMHKVEEKQQQLRITPTIWPVDSRTVTSGFGYRKDPFTRSPSFHEGYDISGNLNDPVYAAADGTVQSTGSDNSHGENIILNHTQGIKTWYMHLNKILVNEGDRVIKGQKIGLLGSTGRSTGPHLHYEVLKNGSSVDPKPYLQSARKDEP